MRISGARTYALQRLREELPANLYYHGLHHTEDVCRVVDELAQAEGVEGENLVLLKTAAVFHDLGFIERYLDNEEIACRIAAEILPGFDYNEDQISRVGEIIMATRLPQDPHSHLGEIMCDADLDYLGRDDFFTIAVTLQEEWKHQGLVKSEDEWNRKQIKFLESHSYFTRTARVRREALKKLHLEIIRKRLAN
jgi:predicted metal-dependent HD superfamily phosphohydrolase